ncbi:hypothetical protein HIM_04075 [Hirsutella minnesotensis 3608]|uniref:Uncharacterized protein n=1 Tax=Hirsutella minnesotensis 3608 TaxID=1043627 RepID=A0A0F8A6A5_9HYPO|nr:hypothetical protein HIM_04075 [Hirsutella minnesotensis 3608]
MALSEPPPARFDSVIASCSCPLKLTDYTRPALVISLFPLSNLFSPRLASPAAMLSFSLPLPPSAPTGKQRAMASTVVSSSKSHCVAPGPSLDSPSHSPTRPADETAIDSFAMALTVSPNSLNSAVKMVYRCLVDPSPHLDYGRPFIRSLGHHSFHVQNNVLGVPLRWGFFSPGPSRLQAMEACLFANLLATVLLILLILVVCACRGESRAFLLRCAAVIPVACVSTYVEARRYRDLVPPSWKRPVIRKGDKGDV